MYIKVVWNAPVLLLLVHVAVPLVREPCGASSSPLRGSRSGSASLSCQIIMVVKRLCFRGFPQLVVITHSRGPFSQVYGY